MTTGAGSCAGPDDMDERMGERLGEYIRDSRNDLADRRGVGKCVEWRESVGGMPHTETKA